MEGDAGVPVVSLWQDLPICEPVAPYGGEVLTPLTFKLLDEPVTFDLRDTQQTPPADACCVALEVAGADGRLFADAAWLDGLCARVGLHRPQQKSWPEIAPSLRVFLLSWVLAHLLSRLNVSCRPGFEPSLKQDVRPGLRRVALSPDGAEETREVLLWLELPDATVRGLSREQVQEGLWQRVPILAELHAGRQMLNLAQLASLRPGDVVLLSQPLSGLHLAVAPHLLMDIREQDGSYVVDSAWYIDERREVFVEDINGETQPTRSVALDQLTVPLVCEVGRLTMSMEELKALRSGSVLSMGRRAGQAVDLMVNGQKVGQGELVRLDGMLGVRVLRLADSND